MNDLRDTRQHVGRTVTDGSGNKGSYALAASEAVFELLSGNPAVEITTIRLHIENENPPRITASGRVGSLVGPAGDPGELTYVALPGTESVASGRCRCDARLYPDRGVPHHPDCPQYVERLADTPLGPECSTCHQAPGRPHTEFCHAGGIVGADPRACSLGVGVCPYTRPHYHRGDDEIVFTDNGSRLNEDTGIMRPGRP